ncbi:Uncharacterised protein [Shigella sonnei]|nr:Uncharacterised protein [Shigella sonnei]
MQTLHMLTMAEYNRSFVRVVATDAFKNRSAIVQRVRHHMHLRVFPANHLPIEPNVISFLRGHFYIPFALRRGFVVMWLCSGRWQRVRRPPVYLTD